MPHHEQRHNQAHRAHHNPRNYASGGMALRLSEHESSAPMVVRACMPADIPYVVRLWNDSVAVGEAVFKPVTEEWVRQNLFHSTSPHYFLVAEHLGRVFGFIHGAVKTRFLPGETAENTPGYLTAIHIARGWQQRSLGADLLHALEDALRKAGKKKIVISGDNPAKLAWNVPGTPGHDHNNAPGIDVDCHGYRFLQKNGFVETVREVAMYMDLKDYKAPADLDARREALRAEGIETGRYDPKLGYDFDRMCDGVKSEYWRDVLRQEIAAPYPRPILAATVRDDTGESGRIVGFTGPVDKQLSGRGWFTGICTDPAYEKKGIGTVLFNLLMQEFIAEGAEFSTLFTGADNHARKVYERVGMRPVRTFAVMEKALV